MADENCSRVLYNDGLCKEGSMHGTPEQMIAALELLPGIDLTSLRAAIARVREDFDPGWETRTILVKVELVERDQVPMVC